ncbi:MAG: LysR family transcriptional regulator, partial [Comamonadaceae bacterium]
HEVLQQLLKSDADHPRGNLRMAAVPTAIPLLARFAACLQSRHPGIAPTMLSMSSIELEAGLENLSLDIALGYTARMDPRGVKLMAGPPSIEHYFLVRRSGAPDAAALRIGPAIRWADAAALPLCLLTPEMHNRSIVDQAFREAGTEVTPAMETNSVLALALAVAHGAVCAVLPGAMVDAIRTHGQLEALPLTAPEVRTPIGFMTQTGVRPSRALDAALALLQGEAWQVEVAAHSGALRARTSFDS